jgi:GNAT superfamily N-acetyltransferase
MGATEHLAIVQLEEADAAAGLALSTEAGWNQNEADWRFFLTKGIVFGVRNHEHRVIATAALLPYTESDAWISMVLVTESWRRQGLATRLVDACINTATKLGVTAWLDATPAGAAVYGPLGFASTIQLRRLRRAASAMSDSKLRAGRVSDFLTLDSSAMGFSRSDLLNELCERPGSRIHSNGDAMALIRDGRTARHIGPVFAKDAMHALAIVGDIAACEAGPLLIDAVASQETFLKGLTEADWTVERPFQRMRFGRARTKADELPFAVAGPEFG